jgi:hypothetical protein
VGALLRERRQEEDVLHLRRSLCIYDAPSPEAVRQAASKSDLPIDRITMVSVLDPYFYR